jgi:hypothetical protein
LSPGPGFAFKSKQPKAKVFPNVAVGVRVGRGIPHGKQLFERIIAISKNQLGIIYFDNLRTRHDYFYDTQTYKKGLLFAFLF